MFASRPPNPFSMPSPNAASSAAMILPAQPPAAAAAAALNGSGAEGHAETPATAPSPYDAALAIERASQLQAYLAEPVRFVRQEDPSASSSSKGLSASASKTEAQRLGYVPCNRPGLNLAPDAAQPASSPAAELLPSPNKLPNTPTSSLPALNGSQKAVSSSGGSSSRTVPLTRQTSPTPSSSTEQASPLTPRTNLQNNAAPAPAPTLAAAPSASTSKATATPAAPAASTLRDLFLFPIPMVFARDTVSPTTAPVGLRNYGNTCYQNSVMQALLHTAPLANILVTRSPDELRGRGGSLQNKGFCTVEATQNFARRALVERKATAPIELNRNLSQFARPLRIGRQEDAHEFLRFLLEGMQKACLTKSPKVLKPSNPLTSTTFVNKIFGGRLRSRVHCLTCGHDSDTFDPFLDLSLDIRSGPVVGGFSNGGGGGGALESVNASLAAFTRLEKLDGKNKYKCEKCKKLTAAHKQFTLDQVPPILTIQLKRFTLTGAKIGRAINFPEVLNLRNYMSANSQAGSSAKKSPHGGAPDDTNPSYRLYAVVHHFGGGPNSGHYVATVRRGNQWYRCDDSSTYPTQSPTGAQGGGGGGDRSSAYVLFYQREGLSVIDLKNGNAVRRASNAGATPASSSAVNGPSPVKRRDSMPPPPRPASATLEGSPTKIRRQSMSANGSGPRLESAAGNSEFKPRYVSNGAAGEGAGLLLKKKKSATMGALLARALDAKPEVAAVNGTNAKANAMDTEGDGDDVGQLVEDDQTVSSVTEQVNGASAQKRKRILLDDGEDDAADDTSASVVPARGADEEGLRRAVMQNKKKQKQRNKQLGIVQRSPDRDRPQQEVSNSNGVAQKKNKKPRRRASAELGGPGGRVSVGSPFVAGGGFGGAGAQGRGPLLGQRPGAKMGGGAGAGNFASKMAPRTTPRL
ncbi:hypothetical protein A4X06_0g4059 [Tilletia controversa]|uniref:ubiquitinyl hydrolase 1 n=1 Tax=Tilletia controversa TaxID=13291 RepID=A0A8X7MTJ8_9BASI|nr:hypothetical protein CF328_g3329 [Tilletia controversa]KAE8247969.1 hypothetical protein A4X06_0g4059 [Tilletia controversa]CAD6975418.1 unnamed protein product [Tilletia controversa]